MKSPLVSIIIPTFNRAQRFKHALKSILDQTYGNIEILVVDDGSTDDTKAVVKNAKDKRIRYFYKKNSGPYDSRNYAIKRSKGKYLAFLDDDDEYHPQKIKTQVDFMQKHPKYGFCYSNLIISGKARQHKLIEKEKKNTYLDLLLDGTGSYVSIQTIFLRRDVVDEVGFFRTDIKRAEDYDYWLKCAKSFKFGYINKILAIYKIHDSNITKEHSKILKWMSVVKLMHLKELSESDIPREYIKIYEWNLNFHQGRIRYYEKSYKEAIPYFLTAIRSDWKKTTTYVFLIQSVIGGDYIVRTLYRIYMSVRFH